MSTQTDRFRFGSQCSVHFLHLIASRRCIRLMQVRIEAMGPRTPDYRYGCSFPTAIRIRTLEGDAKFEGIFRRRDHESSQASQVDGRMQAPTYKRESPADGMLLRCDLIVRETVVEYNK